MWIYFKISFVTTLTIVHQNSQRVIQFIKIINLKCLQKNVQTKFAKKLSYLIQRYSIFDIKEKYRKHITATLLKIVSGIKEVFTPSGIKPL